jgi:hypothetical protein
VRIDAPTHAGKKNPAQRPDKPTRKQERGEPLNEKTVALAHTFITQDLCQEKLSMKSTALPTARANKRLHPRTKKSAAVQNPHETVVCGVRYNGQIGKRHAGAPGARLHQRWLVLCLRSSAQPVDKNSDRR